MTERNQEGYQTLDWVLSHSEQGFYLVVAQEEVQKEILSVYRQSPVGIYDYREHPGPYAFQAFSAWLAEQADVQTIFLANLQFAVQREDDIKRLNFSRDMLASLEKNLIFLTTPYGDDLLSQAYDFYSFLKLRILFHSYQMEQTHNRISGKACRGKKPWPPGIPRRKLEKTKILLQKAGELISQKRYCEAENLLLEALIIRKQLFGNDHLDVVAIEQDLANVYAEEGRYREAETLYKHVLSIETAVMGEDHPNVVRCYHNIATLYNIQGKYAIAEQLFKKAISIHQQTAKEEDPSIVISYNGLASLYYNQGKYEEAERLIKKVLSIQKNVLGKNHPDIVHLQNNLQTLQQEKNTKK